MSIESKQIAGKINKNGAVKIGNNFTASRLQEGLYNVSISPDQFVSTPIVVVTVDTTSQNSNTFTACASVHNVTKNGFDVSIQSLSPEHLDCEFNFIVTEV